MVNVVGGFKMRSMVYGSECSIWRGRERLSCGGSGGSVCWRNLKNIREELLKILHVMSTLSHQITKNRGQMT